MPSFMTWLTIRIGHLFGPVRGHDIKMFVRAVPSIRTMPANLVVTSPSGPSGTHLHIDHTPMGLNSFPGLSWTFANDVPTETRSTVKSWLVIVEDPDAPLPFPIVHALYHDISTSKTTIAPEDLQIHDTTADAITVAAGGFKMGKCWSGKPWSGPRPPLGHGEHRYFFHVLGLNADEVPQFGRDKVDKKALAKWVEKEKNVVAWGEWIGVFERMTKGDKAEQKAEKYGRQNAAAEESRKQIASADQRYRGTEAKTAVGIEEL